MLSVCVVFVPCRNTLFTCVSVFKKKLMGIVDNAKAKLQPDRCISQNKLVRLSGLPFLPLLGVFKKIYKIAVKLAS